MFKHALTHEIVYNGLLKKQRLEIHEQIGRVVESVFTDRPAEFNETLAYHFSKGKSDIKAFEYLIKSGEKSLARYAVEEAHAYFRKAYDILTSKGTLSDRDNITLVDILNNWDYSFYYLGEMKEFIDLFRSHEDTIGELDDKARAGMFYAWLGIAHFMAGKSKISYEYLLKGMDLGEQTGDQKVVGYACAWLPFTCAELGLFAEGERHGERAQKIAELYPSEPYLFFKFLAGICLIHFYIGNPKKILENAQLLLDYGNSKANNRSIVFGYWTEGLGYFSAGDIKSAQQSNEKAIEVALDPRSPFPRGQVFSGMTTGIQL